jgi:hypothetical protein
MPKSPISSPKVLSANPLNFFKNRVFFGFCKKSAFFGLFCVFCKKGQNIFIFFLFFFLFFFFIFFFFIFFFYIYFFFKNIFILFFFIFIFFFIFFFIFYFAYFYIYIFYFYFLPVFLPKKKSFFIKKREDFDPKKKM